MTFYTYGHYTESGRLFYIGKGKERRAFSRADRTEYWHNTVKKYGLKVEIYCHWEDELEALSHEKFLIACFRRDLGFKLCNFTDGGEGSSGFNPSKETRAKVGKASKANWANPEFREKMKTRPKGSYTEKKKVSTLANAEKARSVLQRPEVKAASAKKNSIKSLQMWSDPEFKNRMKESFSNVWTAERRQAKGQQIKGRVRMTNGIVERNALASDVENLLQQGWIRGRGPNSPSKRLKNQLTV